MKIVRKQCARGAEEARGTAVIIDVFRAFSCEPLFFYFQAETVLLESDVERAEALKVSHPEWRLVGEHNEVPLPGADLGNSPSEILKKGHDFFRGGTVIHRTTAGVTGVAAALEKADEVLLGSFSTARALAGYLLRKAPPVVTLVAMGDRAIRTAPEDETCADYIEHLLTGRPYDHIQTLRDVLFQQTAQKFILGTRPYLPREDPALCLQRDLFEFALGAVRQGDRIRVLKRS